MNASGKALIAFWLHKKGEHWTLQSVDKQSTPEVGIESIIIILKMNFIRVIFVNYIYFFVQSITC